jgi:hypothetical protein
LPFGGEDFQTNLIMEPSAPSVLDHSSDVRLVVRGFKIVSLSSFRFCLKPGAYAIFSSFSAKGYPMSSHMPPIPPANRNKKELGANPTKTQDLSLKHVEPQNSSEQGDTANIKQNTTNKGFFQGRRLK